MKVRFVLLWLGLWLAPLVGAQPAPDYVPMKLIQTEPAVYPNNVSALGVIEGTAEIVIQVDEQGELTDTLVIGYSHRSFADAALAALKKWHYEPAFIDGRPHGATMNLNFYFKVEGPVIVNLTIDNVLEVQKLRERSDLYAFWACTLSELDRIPTPKKVVSPRHPLSRKDAPRTVSLTVHFYIDQQGKVRMPAVSRATSQESNIYAAEAINAIAQWEFEPPLSRGRPTLVAAAQEFNFKPGP